MRTRMHLRIRGDENARVVTPELTHISNQLLRRGKPGILERAGRHIAAQRHQAINAERTIIIEQRANIGLAGGDTRQMRHHRRAVLRDQTRHQIHRAVARTAARAISHRIILALQIRKLAAHRSQLLRTLRRCRRKKLTTERNLAHSHKKLP